MRIMIPTYKRETNETVEMLLAKGVDPKLITIGTQRAEDMQNMKERYPECDVFISNAYNVSTARNALMDRACELGETYIMMLDDDIFEFTADDPISAAEDCAKVMAELGIVLMEFDHASADPYDTKPNLWIGWMMTAVATMVNAASGHRYDPKMNVSEDSELALRLRDKLGSNGCAYTTKYRVKAHPAGWGNMYKTKGGCADWYKDMSECFKACEVLAEKYPDDCVNQNGDNVGLIFFWHPERFVNF